MKKVLFSLTMLTVLLSGCVYDDSELFGIVDKNNIEEVGTPLNVTASISEGTSNLRSIIDATAFPNPSSIGVFTLDGGGAVTNAKYEFTTAWATTTTLYIVKPIATVYAYYPHATTTPAIPTLDATIPVTVANEASFTGAGQTDYMWTGNVSVTKVGTSATATLTFKHALSKVSFVVNKGTNFVGTGSLASVTLTKGGLNGTMNVSNGTITGTSAQITFKGPGPVTINNASGTTITCTGLVAPVAAIATTTLTMVIDGISYSAPIPTTSHSAWVAGSNYKYVVTINAGTLSVGTPSITPWTNLDAGAVTY